MDADATTAARAEPDRAASDAQVDGGMRQLRYVAGTTPTPWGGTRTIVESAQVESRQVEAGDIVFVAEHSEPYRLLGHVTHVTPEGVTKVWVDLLGVDSHALRSVRPEALLLTPL